jgi:WD40 repeat protein
MPINAEPVIWRNIKIEYIGRREFDYALDGKDRNAIIRLTNIGDTTINDIYFQVAIDGVGDYPAVTGDGGFAVFPNGGNIDLRPGQSFFAQNWLSGIYETRFGNTPPAVGERKTYSFDFLISFDLDIWREQNPAANSELVGKLTQEIEFIHTRGDTLPFGEQNISGTIANTSNGLNGLLVEISTPYSRWYPVETVSEGDSYTFSAAVPAKDEWLIRVSAQGKAAQVLTADELSPSTVINLVDATPIEYGYAVSASEDTPTGFWRGAVSESEDTFVLFPGQENWPDLGSESANAALRSASLIQKYGFDGELLWEYAPGWETWGGDMTDDGSRVVFLRNPDITRYNAGQWQLGALDGRTGDLLWEVSGQQSYLEGLEAAISPDGRYVAAGSTTGALAVLDGETGELLWEKAVGTYGQVRKLVFAGEHLYLGSGDNFLDKLSVADGSLNWRTYVGGWPFVMGFSINESTGLLAVGTKSKDTTVLDLDTGVELWTRQTGSLDAVLSPDGNYVANFYGDIFAARTGEIVGQTGINGVAIFSNDSQYLIQVDRGRVSISDLTGKLLSRTEDTSDDEHGPGEQSQWAFLTPDGATLVVASRDMDTAGERGVTFWSQGDPMPENQSNPNTPGNSVPDGGQPPAGVAQPTTGNDVFDLPFENRSIDAELGVDTVIYRSPASFFTVQNSNGTLRITDGAENWTHTFTNLERVQFTDKSLAFDLDGHAGQTAKVLGAFLGPSGVTRTDLVKIGLDLLDDGLTYDGLLLAATESVLGSNPDPATLINHFHQALTGVPATTEILATYESLLDSGGLSVQDLVRQVADSDINQQNIDLVGLATTGLEFAIL